MAVSAGEIEEKILALDDYRDRIQETFGIQAAELLENIIYGPTGKKMIRCSLQDLAAGARMGMPKDVIQQRAKSLLEWIEELNANLRKLHDLILFPKKA